MNRGYRLAVIGAGLMAAAIGPACLTAQTIALDAARLQAHDVTAENVTYQGSKAVRLIPVGTAVEELVNPKNGEGGGIAVIPGTSFHDGTIELEVASKPRAGATADARGFVGIAFRVAADPAKYECFYIRPTNGRAEDQLRRNHSTQYISMPEYEWSRFRKETPGLYESYTDLVPGEWTKIKVTVSGLKARLYVNNSPQPVLIVNDLKHGDSTGALALWIGLQSESYFRNLKISK